LFNLERGCVCTIFQPKGLRAKLLERRDLFEAA
jgi:hypothetical protein